ncbi:MAG: DEAD/DEAH box helicase family protein, partial [Azoarcus sp.]|jgi:ERCC4-related helicase|nr:DEAD/DEAH box helicase family protein [Azoarcus sp.]
VTSSAIKKPVWGVLLADDVGLGKTTVGALVAWVFACQGKRVRIYAPNEVLRRRWIEELERHIPMLSEYGADANRIKSGDVAKLNSGRIQVATHHLLVKSHGNNEQRTACDLMIIDEAHRAKGDGSAFNEALHNLGQYAKRKLILTATPMSIRFTELEQLLRLVGVTELDAVRQYANELERLYALGDGYDVVAESKRLVDAAKKAIDELQPYLIRHSIDTLSAVERRDFGAVGLAPWEIPTAPATSDDLQLLLRMDRVLLLAVRRKGERRNDPRFHIGWEYVGAELQRVALTMASDPVVARHITEAEKSLEVRRKQPHPKIKAVSESIHPLLDDGEKVLVFCHHRATASELLSVLEQSLKVKESCQEDLMGDEWRQAWGSILSEKYFPEHRDLVKPIIDWLCSPGIRSQVAGWIGEPANTEKELVDQLEKCRPRHAPKVKAVPTIAEAARVLADTLIRGKSTSAILKNIFRWAQGKSSIGASHFPGHLDDGFRVMGSWDHEGHSKPRTLYAGQPDIVRDIFNSPFGPDVLVATDRLSEGVDLHRYCRHLIHYELDPSPVRTLQRNGRIRRVGSWSAITDRPIHYAYPAFNGTRDEKAVGVMKQRINAFGLLLGGVPKLDGESMQCDQNFSDSVLRLAEKELRKLNRRLAV